MPQLRYLMKLEGTDGEVQTKGFEKWIEVSDFGLDVLGSNHQPSTASVSRAGKATFSGVRVGKIFDKTTAALFRKALSCEVIKKVTLTVISLAGQKVLEAELESAAIGEWKVDDETPDREEISLYPVKITLQSFDVSGRPSSKCTYNLPTGEIT